MIYPPSFWLFKIIGIVAAGDKVTMSDSIYEGIAKITNGNFEKKFTNNSQTTQETSLKPSKDLTKKIIDTYSKVKETLKKSDWASFGITFDALDKLMDQLKKEQ